MVSNLFNANIGRIIIVIKLEIAETGTFTKEGEVVPTTDGKE